MEIVASAHAPLSFTQNLMKIWTDTDMTDGPLGGWGIGCMVTLKELLSTAQCRSGDQWRIAFLRGQYRDQCCLTSLSATWTVGLSAPSASLPKTPSCVLWLTRWGEGVPSRGTLTDLRAGPGRTSWSLTRLSAWSCTWFEEIPSTNTGWAEKRLVAALRRRTQLCCLTRRSAWPHNMCSQPRRPTVSWAASKAAWPAGRGRWFCTLLWWDLTQSPASSYGAPSTRRTWTCWSGSRGVPQRWSKGWNTSPMRKGWESWGCSAWRREGGGETWLQPSSTWTGPRGKMGKIFSAGPVAIGQGVMALN